MSSNPSEAQEVKNPIASAASTSREMNAPDSGAPAGSQHEKMSREAEDAPSATRSKFAREDLRRINSRASTVSADYFDSEGIHALARSLSRDSQKKKTAHPLLAGHHEEAIPEQKDPSSSDVTQIGDSEKPFDFEQILKDSLNKNEEDGVQRRQVGIVIKDLTVLGLGAEAKYQATFGSLFSPSEYARKIRAFRHPPVKPILQGISGHVAPGEMLLVLGRPGSGCSSLLKILANRRDGFYKIEGDVHYDGMSSETMRKLYRGDVVYLPEEDYHFPTLNVKQTLDFAAKCRTPQSRAGQVNRKEFSSGVTTILGTLLGLSRTFRTPVGNEAIRGVSGGEKKRVSIAEALATRSVIAMHDNSTRGLDASTALEYCRALRIATDIGGITTGLSIYQAGERLYELFDRVCILYEGRSIYYGDASSARQYFIDLGFEPADRQTTADFLVAVTDPLARKPRSGFESRVPNSPQEFVNAFLKSDAGKDNLNLVEHYEKNFAYQTDKLQAFKSSARAEHATRAAVKSPYTVNILMQIRYVVRRRFQILRGDMATQVIQVSVFIFQALIVGSLFYNLPEATSAFFSRGGVAFFAILFAALSAMAEISSLYSQRPIVYRQNMGALYHPWVEAMALTLADVPITIATLSGFAIILYFLAGFQRTAAQFFLFWFYLILLGLTMKAFFRALASSFRTESQANAVAGVGVLALVLYTGYAIPRPSMIGALQWITYLNPIQYGFESLMLNEFRTLNAVCSSLIPTGAALINQVCTTPGSVPGSATVDGLEFLRVSYGYDIAHLYRNIWIIIIFYMGFLAWLCFATEYLTSTPSTGSVVIFKRGTRESEIEAAVRTDEETQGGEIKAVDKEAHEKAAGAHVDNMEKHNNIFTWSKLNYTVIIPGGEHRQLLDNVQGWVRPGELTALMGESGAGKTTLLNVLANRTSTGVVSGEMFVNGHVLPRSFCRQTGYVQQLDIHLATATVREALQFSARLRQPKDVSLEEKYAYAEEVIKMCEMEAYADAVIGVEGAGLNVEQRKRLTIGVELAAKPELLLFLDEPTSGLDSQSAWAIVSFLKRLASRGSQGILVTLHQPSSELFQSFDRLLLLQRGGKTVYFGEIAPKSRTMLDYFESNGAPHCEESENPAERLLEYIGAGATAVADRDWSEIWNSSSEKAAVTSEVEKLNRELGEKESEKDKYGDEIYAAPYASQFFALWTRANLDYWRDPTYLFSKLILCVAAGLFVGFTFFKTDASLQGLQNVIFAIFMSTVISTTLSNQLQPKQIALRNIFENREQAARMYSWVPLVLADLLVELPWNILGTFLFFVCWYWTVGLPNDSNRVGYMFAVYAILFPLYFTTFAQAIAAASPNAPIAALLFSTFFSFVILFNGVLQPVNSFPPFWVFMNRLSPFTYLIEAMAVDGLSGRSVVCLAKELTYLVPPSGQDCQSFLSEFLTASGGYLASVDGEGRCGICSASNSTQFLTSLGLSFGNRARDVGFMFAYILFNVVMIFVFTWVFRIKGPGNLVKMMGNLLKRSRTAV